MLIIFDLDDTLIDTTGCVTSFKLEYALKRMEEKGLKIPDFSQALATIRQIDSQSETSRNTLKTFLESYQAPKHFFNIGVEAFHDPLPEEIAVLPWKYTCQTLLELKKNHTLALVTFGNRAFQMEKLKKAGIEQSFFSKLVVTDQWDKKAQYQKIIDQIGISLNEVLVCGDRIALDLSPAKELGLTTVHLRKGRGKNSKGPEKDVDYVIDELEEIKEVINQLKKYG